jgi:hypothetical protein
MDRDEIKDHDDVKDNVPYTEMERHEDWLDPRATGDPSRPQGSFWHQNERPGADAFAGIDVESEDDETASDDHRATRGTVAQPGERSED